MRWYVYLLGETNMNNWYDYSASKKRAHNILRSLTRSYNRPFMMVRRARG